MPETLSNVHAWQAFLFFAGGLLCGFMLFLILYKERLAALRDLEQRELWELELKQRERDNIKLLEDVKARSEQHAKTVSNFMEGRI